MATPNDGIALVTEKCNECGRPTPHRVAVKILTEGGTDENAGFSREPYRVSTCQNCGGETRTRMNNA